MEPWIWILGIVVIVLLMGYFASRPWEVTGKIADIIFIGGRFRGEENRTRIAFTDRLDLVVNGEWHSLETAKGKKVRLSGNGNFLESFQLVN